MAAAPLPADEAARLAALVALDILGTERTAEFDIFPSLAQCVFSTPIAAISLIDANRQWFKASIGLNASETPRDHAFCAHAILNPTEVFCVPDAALDPRFADNPLVTGSLGLRFYAGMPILGPDGDPLGALCVLDREPRQVTTEALAQLKRLAIGVSSALKLHASIQSLRRLASTDPLTGINNWAGFERRLHAALALRDPAPRVGLLFLDLDGFKAINDLFGHAGGDVALKQVALRLGTIVRADDETLLFQYSAPCFNSHWIHLDREFARTVKGFPDLVVNGGLATLLLTEFLRTDHGVAPASITTRHTAPLFCGRTMLLAACLDHRHAVERIVRGPGDGPPRADREPRLL